MVMSIRAVVTTGHYLATEAAMRILRLGGNAADAAAAAGFALAVLKPHQNGIGGEAPMLIYEAQRRKVHALSGQGVAPRAATIDAFRTLGIDVIPGDGMLGAMVPSAVASYLLLLRRFGTLRLRDVLTPATELAEGGFAMYDELRERISGVAERFRSEWQTSGQVFLTRGKVPESGTILRQPRLAAMLKSLIRADSRHRRRDRGLQAAHDQFYRGPVARCLAGFCRNTLVRDASGRSHHGLLTLDDFGDYAATIEAPVRTSYRGTDVYKCGPWTQGPVLLQTLNLLEGYDLPAMGHNSADYIHTVVEAMKLAFADREFYYGDPEFSAVPLKRLLSKHYAADRRDLIDPHSASLGLRPGGLPPVRCEHARDVDRALAAAACGDTTKLEVIDAAGNMVSVTPSGGWLQSSPVAPELGFPLGTRGQMFSLDPTHPNCLAPGKRPRTTLTPSLATRGGRPLLSFGSPGGDQQDQWALQFFLNVVEFGLSLQEAVEAPTLWTAHFPSSFYPRKAEPGLLNLEGRIPSPVRQELAGRGHVVKVAGDWEGGNTLAAGVAPSGVRCAAASPRLEPAYASGL